MGSLLACGQTFYCRTHTLNPRRRATDPKDDFGEVVTAFSVFVVCDLRHPLTQTTCGAVGCPPRRVVLTDGAGSRSGTKRSMIDSSKKLKYTNLSHIAPVAHRDTRHLPKVNS